MVNPTFVIGLGEAGTKMASDIQSAVKKEGLEDHFGFFSLDTEDDTLKNEMDPNEQYHLPKPNVDWESTRSERKYLDEYLDKSGLEGTMRQRPLGRFYLDDSNNMAKFKDKIEPPLKEFIAGKTGDAYFWVLNSLGGGSGSGLFPLVTSLLQQEIIPALTSSKKGDRINFKFIGVGAIPYIYDLNERGGGVRGEPKYAANAYTALRELRGMQGHDGREEFSIEIEDNPISLPNLNKLNIETPLFERYYLLSQQEDDMDKEKLNRITANLVLNAATSPISLENVTDRTKALFDNGIDDIGNIYTFDGGELRVPIKEIAELARFEQTISENEEQIEELKETKSDLDNEVNYLEDVIEGRKPEPSSKVSNEIDRKTRNYSLSNFEEKKDYNDDTVRRHVQNDLLGVFPKKEEFERIDVEQVLMYRYYVSLEQNLRENRNNHQFVRRVERQWTEILSHFSEEQLRDKFPGYQDLDDPGPMQKWRTVVKPHMIEVKEKLSQSDDSGGIFDLGFGGFVGGILNNDDNKTDLDEVKEKLRDIQSLSNQYDQLSGAHERIKGDRNRMRNELQNMKNKLDSERNSIADQRNALQDENHRIEKQRAGKLDGMADPSTSLIRSTPIDPDYIDEVHTKMSYENIEESEASDESLEAKVREETESLAGLVQSKVIDKEALIISRNEIIDFLHDTNGIIEDQNSRFKDNNVLSGLIVMYNEENEELLSGNDSHPSVEQSMEFLGLLKNDQLNDPFSIRFLGVYTELELLNTSELGVIHKEYTENPADVGRKMGKIDSDESFIDKRFAYPELKDENDEELNEILDSGVAKRNQDQD